MGAASRADKYPASRSPITAARNRTRKHFHGGNYATPHPEFYAKTALKPLRAPEHGDLDIVSDSASRGKKARDETVLLDRRRVSERRAGCRGTFGSRSPRAQGRGTLPV